MISRTGRELRLKHEGSAEAAGEALENLKRRIEKTGEAKAPEGTGHDEGPPHMHLALEAMRYEMVRDHWFWFPIWDTPNTIDDPVFALGNAAEISIAASNDGQDVVVATNGGFSFSNDGAQTFNFGGGTPGPNASVDGDPSVTWAQSDTFYYGYIAFPDGTAAWNNVQGIYVEDHIDASVATTGGVAVGGLGIDVPFDVAASFMYEGFYLGGPFGYRVTGSETGNGLYSASVVGTTAPFFGVAGPTIAGAAAGNIGPIEGAAAGRLGFGVGGTWTQVSTGGNTTDSNTYAGPFIGIIWAGGGCDSPLGEDAGDIP